MSAHYALHIIRIHDVTWESKLYRKVPDLYVKANLGDISKQTRTIKKDLSPTWNDTLTFSSSDASEVLTIKVKYKSVWLSDPYVGRVDIKLADLLEKCANDEDVAQLSLSTPPGKASTSHAGVLHVRLEAVDVVTRAGIDIKAAGQDVQQGGIVRSSETADLTTVTTADGVIQQNEVNLYNSLGSLISRLNGFVGFMDDVSKIHPYLNAAWQVTVALYRSVSKQYEADKRIVGLVRTMEEAFGFICDTHSLPDKVRSLEQTIVELLKQTIECCLFVRQYTRHGFAGRMLDLSSEGKIGEFEKSLTDLKKALDSGNILYAAFVSARVSRKVDVLLLQQALNPSPTDAFGRPMCLPGTRIKARQQITDLLLAETDQNIVWLYGVAGSGKSTVSMTIAEYFRGLYRLGAFLSFERGKSQPSSVIRTIAFALASFDSSIATHIAAAVEQDSGIAMASAATQFEKLLLGPLKAAAVSVHGPIVIVLDALDECGTLETRKDLMRLLRNEFPKLPSNFRFLITSRPENDIVRALSAHTNSVHEIELDYTSDDSRRDVLEYIRHEMHEIVKTDPEVEIPKDWPWDANLALLGNAAGGLFIWASTAVKLVSSSDNPFRKLKELVSNSQSLARFGLDELYATVLSSSGITWEDVGSKARFAKVFALLLFSKTPLSNKAIDGILGFPTDEPSHLILSKLRCLLAYTPGNPISLLHVSFSDFLLSPERSADPWFIDTSAHKKIIATRCFAIMEVMLRFNICDLETSFVFNEDVPGLEDRIRNKIPSHLEYACLFWAQHVLDVPFSSDLLDTLSGFIHLRLLYWFEVLSLLKNFGRLAGQALLDASTWATPNADISSFSRDASRLAIMFAVPIAQSTPHIYISMLPFMKDESEVAAHYSKQTSSVVQVEQRGTRPPAQWLKVLEGHTDEVFSVVYSPDGMCIVSGSKDKTIRVWDAQSGEAISEPFEGHTDCVNSIAFSPDGTKIVSGSDDRTIRVWNVENGEVAVGPFEGHTDEVWSVAFSPDGTRIISGSKDRTIRVWDSLNGTAASRPFEGHTAGVMSVAFSPDGTHIVSGSDDRTIRIWDVNNGEVVCGPFEGHTDEIWSVVFSIDGTRIVSGSRDQTIRVWDARSGKIVLRPFEHTDSVTSIAFSPDGKRVVSGSRNNTIIVWDMQCGEIVSGPFEGHASTVMSVAFSSDGRHIVSGSWDKTLRVWDAHSGEVLLRPFEGHRNCVKSVAFSSDGKQVASGSWDKAIRVWDAWSGDGVSRPFEGHLDTVTSVAFSPDGKHLVSGSWDKTVRVWDAQSGVAVSVSRPVEEHLEAINSVEHLEAINSVAFSPDGKWVASGSWDKTIKIWDAQSGEVVYGPFEGHTDGIMSVAFSPDGTHILSGSWDKTIKIWDVQSGEAVSGPFKGHTDSIMSVAFSPDGIRVVSGSWDNTIRVWDAQSGDIISGPFKGHTNYIMSVTFSPDGKRVVSGSWDKTIRVWDVQSGEVVSGPFEGHTAGIECVAFSPDGTHIVSGSEDHTIRVWDAQGREVASGPFEVHTNWALAENGWICGGQRELLLWVPPDLRPSLWRPQNTAVFSCAFSTRLSFRDAAYGARWQECFNPIQ